MPEEEELTPIELSRVMTGRRYYSVLLADYDQLAEDLDEKYGYPAGAGTKAVTMRAIPEKYDVPISIDESSYLFSLAQPHDISEFPKAVEHIKEDWVSQMPEEPTFTPRPPPPPPEPEP